METDEVPPTWMLIVWALVMALLFLMVLMSLSGIAQPLQDNGEITTRAEFGFVVIGKIEGEDGSWMLIFDDITTNETDSIHKWVYNETYENYNLGDLLSWGEWQKILEGHDEIVEQRKGP